MKPAIGNVARCQHGRLGLITGKRVRLWVGISLEPGQYGKPWQSVAPIVDVRASKAVRAEIMNTIKHCRWQDRALLENEKPRKPISDREWARRNPEECSW